MTADGGLPRSRLLLLPRELRDQILTFLVHPHCNMETDESGYSHYTFSLEVLQVCRQLYAEGSALLRRFNSFVSVSTPWPEAEQHVLREGYTPLLVRGGDRAERFRHQVMRVEIEAPFHRIPGQSPKHFILHTNDVPRFAQMWYYSDLTHPGLNPHLNLTLQLCDPWGDGAQVPKALQQALLASFGQVKGLREVKVLGDGGVQVFPSVEQAMRRDMAVPHKPADKCLEEADRLKEEGNAALNAGELDAALRLYFESFRAIHVVIEGRRRSIWGDAFFHREVADGRFKGQHGQLVRLTIRIKLVANIMMVHMKREDWDEVKYWGSRSISVIREAMEAEGRDGHADPVPNFVAAKEMGKIYYRTAIACRQLGNRLQAFGLVKTAHRYLPNDKTVKKDMDELASEFPGFA